MSIGRDILCKAKRIDNGEWVEGNIIEDGVTGQVFIHVTGNSVNESDKVNEEGCLRFVAFEIDPSTVCQYIGLTDIKGKKIYENDIVRRKIFENEVCSDEVIGNIFDNHELLEGKERK